MKEKKIDFVAIYLRKEVENRKREIKLLNCQNNEIKLKELKTVSAIILFFQGNVSQTKNKLR